MSATRVCAGVILVLALAGTAAAQAPVAMADLERLRTSAVEVERQAETLKATDAVLATEILQSLEALVDEVAYLRVKLRRDEVVTRAEYGALRDRIDLLRVRALGQKVSAGPVVADDPVSVALVPVGTEFEVRLQGPLNSGTAKVEQRFEATTVADIGVGGRVVIPAGSLVRGFVSSVRPAGRIDRRGSLTLSFQELRIEPATYRLRASVTQALDQRINADTARIGAGAVVGAIIGGMLGGARGALAGVMVGAGGTIAATDGENVDLPAGTVLRLRLDQGVEVGLVQPAG